MLLFGIGELCVEVVMVWGEVLFGGVGGGVYVSLVF